MSRLSHLAGLLLLLAVICIASGCSNLVQVQGEVTLDGQPLADAQVMLVPKEGRPANGKSNAQGKFRLTTNQPDDGVAPGEYTVTVTANKPEYQSKPGSEQGYIEKLIWIAPEKYSQPTKSGLSQTVTAGTKQVKIELKSAP